MEEWCDLILDWNHLSIRPWNSLFFSWLISHWISSFVMHSSILDSSGFSPSKLLHDSLVSSTYWQEESKETWRSYCGGVEIDKFLNAIKRYSSWEVDIPVVARIREIYWKDILQTLMVCELLQLVYNSCRSHKLVQSSEKLLKYNMHPKLF